MGRARNSTRALSIDALRRTVTPATGTVPAQSRFGARAGQPQTVFIYVLVDPHDGEVRYVGKADQPNRRLSQHRQERDRDDRGLPVSAKVAWMRELHALGLEPRIEILEEVSSANWQACERHWIAQARASGCDLVNIGRGGEGVGAAPLWTDELIRAELTKLCAGRETYPTQPEFATAMCSALWAAIEKRQGHDWWASEMNLPRTSKLERWTRDRVDTELRAYIDGKAEYPDMSAFIADGQERLFFAVYQHGGHDDMAREHGFTRTRAPRPVKWTDELIDQTLQALCVQRADYPSEADFKRAGLSGLYVVIDGRGQGHDHWASKLGLPRKVKASGPTKWTDEAVERTLQEHHTGRSSYMSKREFSEAGLSGLWLTVHKKFGGHATWAAKLGLSMATSAPPTKWTNETAGEAVMGIAGAAGDYPSRNQFAAAGLDGMYQTITKKLGGHQAMAQHLGLRLAEDSGWTDARIRSEFAAAFMGTPRTAYPSQKEFRAAGLWGLCQALTARGGHDELARHFGLARRPARGGRPPAA